MTDPFEKPTMSVDTAAGLLGISRNGAYDAVKRGEIPSIKIGGRVMVISAKLRGMIDAQAPSVAEPDVAMVDKIADMVTARVLRKIAEALR